MATYGRTVRRGLPRRPGGEAWPPAREAPVDVVEAAPVAEAAEAPASSIPAVEQAVPDEAPAAVENGAFRLGRSAPSLDEPESGRAAPSRGEQSAGRSVRRGLPRVPGGEPWPPASVGPAAHVVTISAASLPLVERHVDSLTLAQRGSPRDETPATVEVDAFRLGRSAPSLNDQVETRAVRRGLPRTPGGEPWPPADFAPAAVQEIVVETGGDAAPGAVVPVAAAIDVSHPLSFTRTVWAGASAASRPTALAEPAPSDTVAGKIRATPWTWKIGGLFGALALLITALAGVFLVRAVLSTDVMQEWLARYPGEYHLPDSATPGFPAWVQWQHFFNMFFIVLIIRTGLQVRTEKRPSVFWTPKWSKNGKGKISLALWFHQSLDILWLTNGIIFVVLLFVTGHWMRIVPTSWEVFPNALSALLQYVSLDWPTENGWVNYNSLQQIMYFLTVFVAAPLAVITGVRMSGLWPKNAKALSKAYPVEWARAVHFPVMLYFVVFIIIHVALVFATGALRNLNHMYGGTDVVNWAGFLIFTGSIVLIAAAWIAARPLVLAPIASLSGRVSGR